MTIIDAHGTEAQDKFYHIRFPEDDAQLAQEVHTAAFGGQVAFPSQQELDEFIALEGDDFDKDDLDDMPDDHDELDEDSSSDLVNDWEKLPTMSDELLIKIS